MNGEFFHDSITGRKAVLLLWFWVPPIAYATLIFYLSSLPHPEEVFPPFLSFEMLGDKVIHMIEYGVFGILCFRAFRYTGGPWVEQYAAAAAIASATVYGVTDEIHQLYVPFRQASSLDVLADTIGACVAVLPWRVNR